LTYTLDEQAYTRIAVGKLQQYTNRQFVVQLCRNTLESPRYVGVKTLRKASAQKCNDNHRRHLPTAPLSFRGNELNRDLQARALAKTRKQMKTANAHHVHTQYCGKSCVNLLAKYANK